MDLREQVLALFDYDPLTGWFTNRFSRGRAKEGERAGSLSGHGYRKICIDYGRYYEHHLAWLIEHGYWPDEIDHKDGDGNNNAIDNLRECNRTQNNFNRAANPGESGLKGAYRDHRSLQWYSKIQVRSQVIHLGMFNTAEEAHIAYMEAYDRYADEFAYHNRAPQTLDQEAI